MTSSARIDGDTLSLQLTEPDQRRVIYWTEVVGTAFLQMDRMANGQLVVRLVSPLDVNVAANGEPQRHPVRVCLKDREFTDILQDIAAALDARFEVDDGALLVSRI